MASVLMLNADYMPLRTVNWQRAVTMYFQGKVEVVADREDRWIRGLTVTIKMPLVVRLLQYARVLNKRVQFSRRNIYARDRHICQYCAVKRPEAELTFDHVIPRSHGGRTAWENIVTCCAVCNLKKGGRTPEQARMRLVRRPEAPAALPQVTLRVTVKIVPDAWRQFLYWYGDERD